MGIVREERIGGQRLLLGDCISIMPLLGQFDACLCDPPFGVRFKSGWTGAAIANDNDLSIRDTALSMAQFDRALVFGAYDLPKPAGTRHTLIWHRPGSGMGDLAFPWKPDYEAIFVIGQGFKAAQRGASVLSYSWDVFRGNALHPHQKPVALIGNLLSSCPGDTILDPFAGSGTVSVACEKLGRQSTAIEIDPEYFDIACRRVDEATRQPDLLIDNPYVPPVQEVFDV